MLNRGKQTVTFILDIERVVDTLPHKIMKCVLCKYDIGDEALKWIDSV